jgi:Fe-S-cluster containining protein
VSESAWHPRLRPDLQREHAAGRLLLVDPVFDRRIPVGPLSAALVERLDGSQSLPVLIDSTAAATSESTAEVRSALRSLLLLGLLDGANDFALAEARADSALPTRTLPRARFGCLASGQCCHVYRPGPLTDDDAARLEAHAEALREAYPDLPPGPWIARHTGDDGGTHRYLERADGRCVFLLPDRRCGVHAVAGREAKPEACRLFPFDAVRTLDGLRVFDVSQCSAFATTSRAGDPHASYAPEVVDLSPVRPRLFHPLVSLDAALPCDYAPVQALESRLLELANEPTATRMPRSAALAHAFVDALRECPLAPGEPTATVHALLAADRDRPHAPVEADPSQWALAVDAVADALEGAATSGEEPDAPLIESFRETVAVLRGVAAQRAGLADGPLPELVQRALALPLDTALVDEVLSASLRNRLFGAQLLIQGHLRAGILRLALHELLTLSAARVRAAAEGAERVREEDLSAGHWIASLGLARPKLAAALLTVQDQAWTVAACPATALVRP